MAVQINGLRSKPLIYKEGKNRDFRLSSSKKSTDEPFAICSLLATGEGMIRASCKSGLPDIKPEESDSTGSELWTRDAMQPWLEQVMQGSCMHLEITDGDRVLQLGFVRRKILPGLVLGSTFPYASLMGDRALLPASLSSVRDALSRHGISSLEIALTGEGLAWAKNACPALLDLPRHYSPARHVIHLASYPDVDAYLIALDPRVRWSIRKANRMNVAIRPAEIGELPRIQQLYRQTMQEKGAPTLYGSERFGLIMDRLRPHGLGDVYVAESGGRCIGMAAVVTGKQSAHLIQVAVPRAYRSLRASDALVFHAIAKSIRSGRNFFDFMASSPGDTGVAEYKRKWLSQEEPLRYILVTAKPTRSRIINLLRWARHRI